MSSMLGHCWLDRWKGIRPVKTDFWFDDVTGALQVLACTMATSVMYGCSGVQNGLTTLFLREANNYKRALTLRNSRLEYWSLHFL